jgi:hypothetical protein
MGMRAHNARWWREPVERTPSNTFVPRHQPSREEIQQAIERQRAHEDWARLQQALLDQQLMQMIGAHVELACKPYGKLTTKD